MLAKTCKIAEHLAFYDLHGRNLPQRLRDACEALGTEILSWTIDLEPFSLPELDKGTMREIARCQARAFHKAVLIYYHRTVQKHGMVRDPTVDVDDQVQAVWRNLTEAEDLKDAYTGGVKRSAPMSWPAFIAACEATDRQCWTAWWERVSGYCIGNFTRQWHIIQELWSIQDAREGRSMSWRDALAQTGRLILPI
jgi:arginine metabolism regulation protein II